MLARARLFVGQHVEQQPDRPHVERNQDEAPLHHDRFRIVPVLVPGDVGGGSRGQDEPAEQEVIYGLDERQAFSSLRTACATAWRSRSASAPALRTMS